MTSLYAYVGRTQYAPWHETVHVFAPINGDNVALGGTLMYTTHVSMWMRVGDVWACVVTDTTITPNSRLKTRTDPYAVKLWRLLDALRIAGYAGHFGEAVVGSNLVSHSLPDDMHTLQKLVKILELRYSWRAKWMYLRWLLPFLFEMDRSSKD